MLIHHTVPTHSSNIDQTYKLVGSVCVGVESDHNQEGLAYNYSRSQRDQETESYEYFRFPLCYLTGNRNEEITTGVILTAFYKNFINISV